MTKKTEILWKNSNLPRFEQGQKKKNPRWQAAADASCPGPVAHAGGGPGWREFRDDQKNERT